MEPDCTKHEICPVCEFVPPEPLTEYSICAQCGTEFGYDDHFSTHAELRQRWIDEGCVHFMTRLLSE